LRPATKSTKASRGDVVARLSIQKIHLRAMVREGDDDNTLDVALGHIPGTAMPGQKGNVGVAGHRDRLFRRLAEVGRNDQIQLQTPAATYTYRVDDMAIVSPKMVSVLAAAGGAHLTLVTCYPFNYIGSAPKRYIVKAHLVSQDASRGDITSALRSPARDHQ
jgi:sortase A